MGGDARRGSPRRGKPFGHPGPSVRRRTHRRYRIGSGSPPCCPQSRWPCTSRTRMGRSPVGEGVGRFLRGATGGAQGSAAPPPFTPSSSAPLTLLGSGIPEGAPRGGGCLSTHRTPGSRGPGSRGRLKAVRRPQWSQARLPRSLTPTNPPAGLTSGKEPWLYTISNDVLPQPPSPTITIFSSFLPGPAFGPGAPGASIAVSSRHPQPRAGQSSGAERSGAGAESRGRGEINPAHYVPASPPPGSHPGPPPSLSFPFCSVPDRGVHFSFPGKLRQLRNGGTQPEARLPLPSLHVKARPPPTRFDRFRRSSQGTSDWQAPPSAGHL